jgi:hypothetical protein
MSSAGAIYHLKYKPPPAEIMDRLVQRSDDTEEKVRMGGTSWWPPRGEGVAACWVVKVGSQVAVGAAQH